MCSATERMGIVGHLNVSGVKEAIDLIWNDQSTSTALLLAIGLRERCAEIGLEGLRQELQAVMQQLDVSIAEERK